MMRRFLLFLFILCLVPSLALAKKHRSKPEAPTASDAQLLCPATAGVGEAFLVRLRSSRPSTQASLTFQGRTAPVELRKAGKLWEGAALLGTDVLDAAPGRREVLARLTPKGKSLRAAIEIHAVKRPTESLTLDPAMVNPPREALPRIARERAQARAVLGTASPLRLHDFSFARPTAGAVSSIYGIGRVLNGEPHAPHRGLDLEAEVGDAVVAAADGVVALVGDFYYAGRCVYVDHGQGMYTLYFHLSEPKVDIGQRVARGQLLGLAGETGRSTRPHLHFSVSTLGRLVDPEPLFGYTALP